MSATATYLVVGATGSWDEHAEWVVCGYLDPELAAEHARRAEAWRPRGPRSPNAERNPYDPENNPWPDPPTYEVQVSELRDAVPTVPEF